MKHSNQHNYWIRSQAKIRNKLWTICGKLSLVQTWANTRMILPSHKNIISTNSFQTSTEKYSWPILCIHVTSDLQLRFTRISSANHLGSFRNSKTNMMLRWISKIKILQLKHQHHSSNSLTCLDFTKASPDSSQVLQSQYGREWRWLIQNWSHSMIEWWKTYTNWWKSNH